MEKITFIINPTAGYKRFRIVEESILKYINKKKFKFNIEYSKEKGDVKNLTKKAISYGANIIIAVGGDGTVNEVSSELVNSNVKMGVIPVGSGNGLALCLGIPTNIKKAIQKINSYKIKKIDCLSVNKLHSVNLIGFGFDASVAKEFSKEQSRGLVKYVYLTCKLLLCYKPKEFTVRFKNKIKKVKVFSLNICNGQQFGNNFLISPKSKVDDGYLRIGIIKALKWYQLIYILFQFIFKKVHKSKFYESFKVKKILIEGNSKNLIHIDGESQIVKKLVEVNIIPKSINFII